MTRKDEMTGMQFRQPKRMPLAEYLKKIRDKGLSDDGRLIPSSVPIAPPIGYKKHPSMVEIVRDMVRSERLADEVRRAGAETFEESEDFDVGDDPEDLKSGFENDFDPPISEVKEEVEKVRSARARERASDPVAKGPGEREDPQAAVEPGETPKAKEAP